MNKIVSTIVAFSMIISCAGLESIVQKDSGTFRGKWYNYYNRGLAYSYTAQWDDAEKDLITAISKRSRDQRMARTYGMHFIDYFPHRELGITYLNMGEIEKAIKELEESISHEESAKAFYYLNRARKEELLLKEEIIGPPFIAVYSPMDGAALNSFTTRVKGSISGEGYVSRITINNEPYRFDLARKTIVFEKEIVIEEDTDKIVIVSEDLLGNVSMKTLSLNVDRAGPTINIFDIYTETENGRETVRITGEVNDSTGIRKLLLDDRNVAVNDSKDYQFDISMERGSGSMFLVIKAFDILNNETTAEIDIEEELSAFCGGDEPVLLAFNGNALFSLDDIPPVIRLKDSDDIPSVFVAKYYVEGEVADNQKVEEIRVNGLGIQTKQGRKIFFSKVVKLEEGNNEIDVEAYDSSGNRAESDFSVIRNIPDVLQVGSRMSISILPFDDQNQGSAIDQLAYEQLIGSFVDQKRFNVIERTKLEQVLLEQKLTREKLTDTRFSIEVGRIMAADAILSTALVEDDKSVEFIARVINTETSEIMEVKDVYSEDKSSASIKQLMDGLASKIAGSFPLVEGIVIKNDKKHIFTDIGSETRVKRDMGAIVYRRGKEMRHPVTGKSLGWNTEKLGEGNIEEIHEDFSKVRLSDTPETDEIAIMDMVITK